MIIIRYKTLVLFGILSCTLFSQPINDLYLKVEKKLSQDKNYLDLFSVTYTPEESQLQSLSNIPRGNDRPSFSFRKKDGVTYQLVFKKETIELDSITLLYVKEIEDKQTSGESFFGDASQGPQIDTLIVLTFGDIQDLFDYNPTTYNYLYTLVKNSVKIEDPEALLKLVIDDSRNKSKGISFIDNRDFLSHMRLNSTHIYPVDADDQQTQRRTRRSGETTTASNMQIDASFSHLTFYHNALNLGFGTISAEIDMGSKVLNLLPYQTMGMSFGMRTLFSLKGNLTNLKNDFVIDAKILGRARLNTSDFVTSLPFLFGQKPTINVGPGFIVDLSTSRLYGFPFLNFYLSTSSGTSLNPYISFGPPATPSAYFSFNQWEATFSYFWNSSEERTVRFKMDLGAANYDVYKVDYSPVTSKTMVFNKTQPVISLQTTFAPLNSEFLSAKVKFYDGVMNLYFWMKIIDISGVGSFRLETNFMSAPMFRSLYPWETEGSNSMVQIRYRYGF